MKIFGYCKEITLRVDRRKTRRRKQEQGDQRVVSKKPTLQQDYNLNWFIPKGKQQDIQSAMETKELIVVNSPSGTGKSSTIIHKALQLYKMGEFQKILLIKTPSEAGSDQLGFLSGDKSQKLEAHMESMKSIFLQFLTKNKLENDVANGNIKFDVPTYIQGTTYDNTIIILEEAQNMNPDTIKLCAERVGQDSIVVIAGDDAQCYAAKKRPNGLKDLVERITYEQYGVRFPHHPKTVAYVEMTSADNQRSNLSRYITEVYKE